MSDAIKKLGSFARIPLSCLLAAALALGLTQFSLLARVEIALSDHYRFSEKATPGQGLVLVVVDETTIKKTGKYPFDRFVLARALNVLNAAGAKRIYLDSSLSAPHEPDADHALETAFQSLGSKRIAIPASRIGKTHHTNVLTPLPRFSRHTSVVTTDASPDFDYRVRNVSSLPTEGYKLSADWLHNPNKTVRTKAMPVNFSFDPSTFRRVEMLAVSEGRIDTSEFKGKNIIIGVQLTAPELMVQVPIYRRINRIDLIALALETVVSRRPFAKPSPSKKFLITLYATFAVLALILALPPSIAFLVSILFGTIWLLVIEQLQRTTGTQLPVLTPPLAALFLWQSLKYKAQ